MMAWELNDPLKKRNQIKFGCLLSSLFKTSFHIFLIRFFDNLKKKHILQNNHFKGLFKIMKNHRIAMNDCFRLSNVLFSQQL